MGAPRRLVEILVTYEEFHSVTVGYSASRDRWSKHIAGRVGFLGPSLSAWVVAEAASHHALRFAFVPTKEPITQRIRGDFSAHVRESLPPDVLAPDVLPPDVLPPEVLAPAPAHEPIPERPPAQVGSRDPTPLEPIKKAGKRPHTLNLKRMSKRAREEAAQREEPPAEVEGFTRPRTRGDCADGPRPCPWIGCRHHTYLEVHPRTGNIKLVFPDREPDEIPHSCSLDVQDGGMRLEEVGNNLNVTREMIRQIEARALRKVGGPIAQLHGRHLPVVAE